MKHLFIYIIFFLTTVSSYAQRETFDLLTYAKSKDSAGFKWAKEATAERITYASINNKTNTFCQIYILKSVDSKGDIEQDFNTDWQQFIVRTYKPTGTPETQDVIDAGDWKIKAGRTKFTFNNKEALAMLATMTGHNKCLSVVIATNSQAYTGTVQAFLASFDLKKPAGECWKFCSK